MSEPYAQPPRGRPNRHQLETLRRMAATPDQCLVRVMTAGGGWTLRPLLIEMGHRFRKGRFTPAKPPAWSVPESHVRSLESRGWIARTNVWAEEYRDDRRITPAGLAWLEAHGGGEGAGLA